MTFKSTATISTITFAAGMLSSYFFLFSQKPQIVEKERIIYVNTTTKGTLKRIITRSDGTRIEAERHYETNINSSTTEVAKYVRQKNWLISLGAVKPLNSITGSTSNYSAQLQRRLVGPLFVGLTVTTESTIGASLGLEF